MSEKKKLGMQSVEPVVGGISEDGEPVNRDVLSYKRYCISCNQNGWPLLSFGRWDQLGWPVAYHHYTYDMYCNNCRAQSLIPFSFYE